MNQPNQNQVAKMEGTAISQVDNRTPIDKLKDQMGRSKKEFAACLPNHITFEKLQRTVVTAAYQNPDILTADRQSLMTSCLKAATDGLLPDGRDAALVLFKSKVKDESGKDKWIMKVQYLPMYAGILKKVRQSKELASVVAHVVYQKDKFEYFLGDDERIEHAPTMDPDRGSVIAAYAVARLTDGTIIREVMTFADIEKVRRSSKSGAMNETDVKYNQGSSVGDPKGIWRDWFDEMARKTVFRRLAKWLPQSAELMETAFENDDSMEVLSDNAEAPAQDYIDQDTPAAALTDDSNQPDLKAEIEKANHKKADLVPAQDETKADQSATNKAEVATDQQKDDPKQEKSEPSDLQKKFDRVRMSFETSDSETSLFDAWNKDYLPEITEIGKKDKAMLQELETVYNVQLKKLRAAEAEEAAQ